jgi:hypothetical protein
VRWYLRPEERLPQPPLPETDDRLPVLVGTAVWAVLAVVAWVGYDDLDADGRGWWLWTAVCGTVLGVVGYAYMQRRKARERADAVDDDG